MEEFILALILTALAVAGGIILAGFLSGWINDAQNNSNGSGANTAG